MTAAAAVGAVAAAADGLLDEHRTCREEHGGQHDQRKDNITDTHRKSLLSNPKEIS